MQESFWWNDPKSLVTQANWKQFVPRGSNLSVHNLNNIARFILYLGIASWLYFQKQEIILFTLIALMATVIIYKKFVKGSNMSSLSGTSTYAQETEEEDELTQHQNAIMYPEIIKSTSYERPTQAYQTSPSKDSEVLHGPSVNIANVNLVGVMNTANISDQSTNPTLDARFQVPDELFDMEQGRLNVKPVNADDKLISKGIETNGLPNDNMPNMGAEGLPAFDLRPGSNCGAQGQMPEFDQSQSLFLKNDAVCDSVVGGRSTANNLASIPASLNSLQDAFKMGDRLGDNIRRDNDIHSAPIDFSKTPNNMVCGPRNPNLGIGGGIAGNAGGRMPGTCNPGSCESTRGLLGSIENRTCGSSLSPIRSETCGPCKFNTQNPCQMATPNNAFGNILPTDNVGNPGRGPSCLDRDDTDNKWTFAASPFAAGTGSLRTPGQGLFRNVDDVFDRNNGQMAFNTLPNTIIPSDQDAYLKFLYHVPYVCKDGDMEACYGIDEIQTRKAGQILAL